MRADVPLKAPLTIGAFFLLACLAHWQLVFQGLILADYDAFVYFYANREYTAARLLEGQLPLWNPYVFAGTPHLANPQSAVFYPGTWIFTALSTPYAYTVNLILHTALAGLGMALFTQKGLGAPLAGGILSGICYMLGGAITAQGGHLNQLSAAAWLPFILLALQRTVAQTSVRWASLSALLLGMQLFCGHPQVTYMTLIVAGLMILWMLAASPPARWLASGVLVGVVLAGAAGLSALQLLPTLQATRQGIRSGGLVLGEATASSLPLELLPLALLPGYSENPPSTEFLGFIGVVGLILAVIGAVVAMPGRHSWLLVTAIVSLLLALGSNTAVFAGLFGIVPGLDAFRVPARWLLPWSVAVSALAGLSWQRTRVGWPRKTLGVVLAAIPIGLAVWAGGLDEVASRYPVPPLAATTWLILLPLTLGLWLMHQQRWLPMLASVLVVGVSGELLFARLELPFSHAVPASSWRYASETVDSLRRVLTPSHRMVSIAGDGYQPANTAALRERYATLTPYAFDQLLTAVKWAEVQAPNLPSVYRIRSIDGYDGGVFPMRRFVLASSLLHPIGDVRPDGVLISSLDAIPRDSGLDLFAVKAVVASFQKDIEVNGVAFDRAVTWTLAPGARQVVQPLPDWPIGRVLLLLAVPGGGIDAHAPALEVRAHWRSGQVTTIPLSGADLVGTIVPAWRGSSGLPSMLAVEVALPGATLDRLELENVSAGSPMLFGGLTAVGSEPSLQTALALDPLLTVHELGDTRIYERQGALPRAYVVHRAEPMPVDDAIIAMFEPDWSPSKMALIEPGATPHLEPGQGSTATILESLPERVTIQVNASGAGLLLLSDPWYPGWTAYLDGQPAPLLRANIHFRAVAVPGGLHEVRFVYDPAVLKLGALLTITAAGLLAALAVVGTRLSRMLT